jgi:hypothetical protein
MEKRYQRTQYRRQNLSAVYGIAKSTYTVKYKKVKQIYRRIIKQRAQKVKLLGQILVFSCRKRSDSRKNAYKKRRYGEQPQGMV